MKASINHILSFIIMTLILFLSCFLIGEYQLRSKRVLTTLNNINYYSSAYKNIKELTNDFIINSEIKEAYNNYINKDLIKKDISLILINKSVSRYNDFKNIISNYTNDKIIIDKYSNYINNIYIKNIFPIKEYNLINKFKFNNSTVLFVTFVTGFIIFILSSILYLINKEHNFYKIILMSDSIMLLLPRIIIKPLFNNFIYTNKYFTKFLLSIINNIFNSMFIVGILIILILIFFKKRN